MNIVTDRHLGARYALRVLMWVLSEWNWTVDWAPDLEYALWQAVVSGPPVQNYPVIGDAEAAALRLLAHEAGGWYWAPPGETDEQFIDIDAWRTLFDAWQRR